MKNKFRLNPIFKWNKKVIFLGINFHCIFSWFYWFTVFSNLQWHPSVVSSSYQGFIFYKQASLYFSVLQLRPPELLIFIAEPFGALHAWKHGSSLPACSYIPELLKAPSGQKQEKWQRGGKLICLVFRWFAMYFSTKHHSLTFNGKDTLNRVVLSESHGKTL